MRNRQHQFPKQHNFKDLPPEMKRYLTQLEHANQQLEERVRKLQAQMDSDRARVRTLEKRVR